MQHFVIYNNLEDIINLVDNKQIDFNQDGFRDIPTGNQLNLINRYKFDNSKGLMAQFGFKILRLTYLICFY